MGYVLVWCVMAIISTGCYFLIEKDSNLVLMCLIFVILTKIEINYLEIRKISKRLD